MGAPEYGDYKMPEEETQMTGGNGRIDITGKRRAEAAYTLVALEQEEGPLIGVQPVDRDDDPSLTGWSLTKAVESWAWNGCEGKKATVEVYSRALQVELRINGRPAGRKKTSKTARTLFTLPYQNGTLTAVNLDEDGHEMSSFSLTSASEQTCLSILPEEQAVKAGGLSFIRLRYTDEEGVWKPLERHTLKVNVENGELLGLGCANSYVRGNYTRDTTDTYYGEALAIVRAGDCGEMKVIVCEEGSEEAA